MRSALNRALALALISCAAGILYAQPPSNWTTVTLPPNQTSLPASIGTSVAFMTTDSAWLYSGITKEWTILPLANPGNIFQANDYCVLVDGNDIHGYATHTGKVDSITTSGNPTLVSGPASSSWVTLVSDGLSAWGFGAFHGKWEPLTLNAPDPVMMSNRLIGLLRDGSTVYGLNAHYGTFVPVAADPSATLQVVGEGEVGVANSPGVFRAFSAQQNVWGVQAVPVGSNSLVQNEYAAMWSGNQIWAFSGLTGTFDTYVASGPITTVSAAEGVCAFIDGGNVVCYSSGRGQFVSTPATGATFVLDYHFALVVEPGQVTPFSSITGTFGIPLAGTFQLSTNDAIGFADGTPFDYAYSPILNKWIQTPLSASPSAVVLVRDSVVLVEPFTYRALSARHTSWRSIATAQSGNFQAPNSGSTFVAIDGAGETLWVFDARLNHWAEVVGQGPMQIKISRHTVMATDGVFGYGFGQPSGEWYVEPLNGPPIKFDTASSIGTISHATELSVYSVQGSFSYTGRYPEFTQAINLGNTLRLHQVAPPGSALTLLLGAQPNYIDMGPTLGHLYIDPSFFAVIPWPQTVDGDGMLDIDLPIPNDPILIGVQPQLQMYVQPPLGADPWLSSSVAPVLY